MSIVLLKISLILSPFYELIAKLFPYVSVHSPDTRVAKVFLSMWLALAVGISAIYKGSIKKCCNIWLLLFIIYIPLSIHLAPKFLFKINGINATNFWVWRPFLTILCYFLMFLSVQSLNITRQTVKSILNIAVWCGVVMAGYIFLQTLGWDQFYQVKDGASFLQVTKRAVVGNLGQSTIVSPYLAMIIPLALYLRRYFAGIALICAVLLTQSIMAIGGMVVSLIVYSCFKWRVKALIVLFVVGVVGIVTISGFRSFYPREYKKTSIRVTSDNGRSWVWKNTVEFLKKNTIGEGRGSTYSYTGIGLGSYPVIIKPSIKTHFAQVHNEYLELMCTVGIVGLVLFIASILFMLKQAFYAYLTGYNRDELVALSCSFICIALIAWGTFVWQIAPIIFYTVVIVGLLSNQLLIKGELDD